MVTQDSDLSSLMRVIVIPPNYLLIPTEVLTEGVRTENGQEGRDMSFSYSFKFTHSSQD